MPKFQLFCFCLLICISVHTQTVSFDFENRDISSWYQADSGRWEVDTLNSVSGKCSLHHCYNNTIAGTDMIVFPHNTLFLDSASTSWEFLIKYNYNPSSSNSWSIWFINNPGDDDTLPGIGSNGYIVGVNYQGSDDYLKLWKKDKTGASILLTTAFNWQQNIAAGRTTGLRIDRSVSGNWFVFIDTLGSASWNQVGSIADSSYKAISDFGIYYKYTATQDRKLWLDNISINGFFYADIFPPKIDSFKIQDRYSLRIFLNEPVDTSLPITARLNDVNLPQTLHWINNRECILMFTDVFPLNNHLELFDITDIKGNKAEKLDFDFTCYIARKHDVLITEIMADPSPLVGLPECEYLELYNRSDYPVDINNWKLFIGANEVLFPPVVLNAKEYYLLTKSSCTGSYGNSIHKIVFSSLPALINAGTLLQITDSYGKLIEIVEYSDTLYKSVEKREGGWSLERINFNNPCIGPENWGESVALSGGTPGLENSVTTNAPDYTPPTVVSVTQIDTKTLLVSFSENMDSLSASSVINYEVNDVTVVISSTLAKAPFYREAWLTFTDIFPAGRLFTLKVSSGITDCSGNGLIESEWQFGTPEEPDSGDLIINEILFEASDAVPEFIEIYNTSDKIFDLQGMSFAVSDAFTNEKKDDMTISDDNLYLYPGEYAVFTEDKQRLLLSFSIADESKVFELQSWMGLTNEGGWLSLYSKENKLLDRIIFNTHMHFSLLTDTKGVSLERISPLMHGNLASSWHSAAESVGFATPASKNSQFTESSSNSSVFQIEPKEISPDSDGINDFVTISYSFEKPGFMLSVWLFNSNGFEIQQLVNNELCGTSGSIQWDGLGTESNRLPMGYYVLIVEAIHPDGNIIKEKKAVLLLPEKK